MNSKRVRIKDTIEEIDEDSNSEVSKEEAATKLAKTIANNFINKKKVEPKNENFNTKII